MPAAERIALVDRFSEADGHAVLVSQVQAGGVGMNLQAASVVILCKPQIKPTMEEQAVARRHRMGQVRTVQAHRLLAADSVDQRMLEILDEKARLFDRYARHRDVADTTPEAHRMLAGMAAHEIRERLNRLLGINVLQRGLIVPCSECERRTFYRIDLVGESNTCPRCGAPAHATAAWRSKHNNEPEWFNDVHGAVRELLKQNGDVPFLAGRALANRVRSFEDVAELDFCRPNVDPAEIDIVALVDGRLIIGEAKINANLGTKKEAAKSIAKLLDASDLLGADEIVLTTTHPGPWEERDIEILNGGIARREWRFGKAPRVRVMPNLRGTS